MNYFLSYIRNKKLYVMTLLFITFYLLGSAHSFAGDITYSNTPVNLIVNDSADEMKIILDFEGTSDDISVTSGSATLFSVAMTEANGVSFSGDDGQLTITVDDSMSLVTDILGGGDPVSIDFAANVLSDGTDSNLTPIIIDINAPQAPSYFSVDDYNTFKVSTYARNAAPGSQVFVFFNKADFEKEYPDYSAYYESDLLPKTILAGELSAGGVNSVFSKVFTFGDSLNVDITDALEDTPYTGIYLTTSDPGQLSANDYGTILFDGAIAEGMRGDGTSVGRPTVTAPRRFLSYYLSQADSDGYNAYVIVNFENDISVNINDSDGNPQLPLGIDFRQDSADDFINFSEVDFDACISGSKLILKFKDDAFIKPEGDNSNSTMLFVTIPRGTLKDTTSEKANTEITLFDYFNLDASNNPTQFVHGQVNLASIDTNADSTLADVELNTMAGGSVYNSYIAVDDFDIYNLEDGTSLIASAIDGSDKEISASQITEVITGVTSGTAMKTSLLGLTPETDYYWISTIALDDAIGNDDILEGHITKFTTLPPMSMTNLTYDVGPSSDVIADDFVIATFSSDLTDIGDESDYRVWIDYDSDGTLDIELDNSDYEISTTSNPQEVRFDWVSNLDTYLANKYKASIKVKVESITALEPDVSSSARYLYADIAGRNNDLLSAHITLPNTSVMIPVENFDATTTTYSNLLILPSIAYDGSTTILGVAKDSNAILTPSNMNSMLTMEVVAEEGYLSKAYTFQLTPDRFLLRDIKLDGDSLNAYYPHVFTYDIELTRGTNVTPTITTLLDDPLPSGVEVSITSSGDLATGETVTIETLDLEANNTVIHTYTLNFTVREDEQEPEPDTPSSNDDDSSSETSSDSNDSKNDSPSDDNIIDNTISTNGSLLDIPSPSAGDQGAPSDNTQGVTAIIKRIKTANGARVILEQMPKTLEELTVMKSALDSLDESLQLDKDIAALITETERLIGLLQQPQQSRYMVLQVINPLGTYYNNTDKQSTASKDLMNSAIQMANTSIAQAGTVQTSWQSVEIKEGGRVALAPSEAEILQAARKAAQAELDLEGQLKANFEQGLENGVVSSITINIPKELSNAQSTAAELTPKTFETMKANNIQQVNLNLGPVSFGVDQQFFDAQNQSHLEFNVDRQAALSSEEEERLPAGTKTVGAPVLELSALQNHRPDNAFNRPLNLTINLDAIELESGGIIDYPNELVIYRENPDTGEWEPVGGTYDPITNSISTPRMHLSKYTVLKSEKNYSNIEDSWAINEIATLQGKGIIDNNELFASSDNVTREEFAGWISNAYGLESSSLESDLKDLDPESPYYDAIATAYEQGIISGKSDGTFDPNSDVSKEEMAVMIAAAMTQYDHPVNTDTFELAQYEEDIPTWAVGAVETVVENGAVDESFFGSADAVTKEEAAAILYQVYR